MKYVSDKDRKPFCTELKTICQAPTEEKALDALERVTKKWTMPICGWGQVYGELSLMYEGRLPERNPIFYRLLVHTLPKFNRFTPNASPVAAKG